MCTGTCRSRRGPTVRNSSDHQAGPSSPASSVLGASPGLRVVSRVCHAVETCVEAPHQQPYCPKGRILLSKGHQGAEFTRRECLITCSQKVCFHLYYLRVESLPSSSGHWHAFLVRGQGQASGGSSSPARGRSDSTAQNFWLMVRYLLSGPLGRAIVAVISGL